MEDGLLVLLVGVLSLACNISMAVRKASGRSAVWYNQIHNNLSAVGAWIASLVAIAAGLIMVLS